MSKKRNVLRLKLAGGLGNQLFQLGYVRQQLVAHDSKCYVDCRSYRLSNIRSADERCITLILGSRRIFKLSAVERIVFAVHDIVLFAIRGAVRLSPPRWNDVIFDSVRPACGFIGVDVGYSRLEPRPLLRRRGIETVAGYFQWPSGIPSRTYMREVLLGDSKNLSVFERTNAVAIGLRLGDDYVRAKDLYHCPGEFLKRAKKILSTHGWKEVIVFSDDQTLARYLVKRELDGIVRAKFAEGDALEQLGQLAMCKSHIFMNSSFLWWGWYLSCSVNNGFTVRRWLNGYEGNLPLQSSLICIL